LKRQGQANISETHNSDLGVKSCIHFDPNRLTSC
jgi:hypothetical protein